MLPSVVSVMGTCGRNYLAKRGFSFFLNQDYEGRHTLLIYNNSEVSCKLKLPDNLPPNKEVILINNHISHETNSAYKNLGEIYRDAITYIPDDVYDVISFQDDDDIFLPTHISEGVKGYLKAKELGKIAYKPQKSYYKHAKGIELIENTLEPSIFVEFEHVKKYKFSDTTTEQHLQWVDPLTKNHLIFVDEEGIPTLIYDWSGPIPTFKTSGDCTNPNNFHNYRMVSKQHGNRILEPLSDSELKDCYNII